MTGWSGCGCCGCEGKGEPRAGGEELYQRFELVMSPLANGGQVGLDDREVGEALQGSPPAGGGPLLDPDRPLVSLRGVVAEGDREVGGEPEDHVLVCGRGGAGGASNTGAPARSAPQPLQAVGSWRTVSSGSSTNRSVVPGVPSCLPRRLPDTVREDRFGAGLTNGRSDDDGGGFEEFDGS